MVNSVIAPHFLAPRPVQHFRAEAFPTLHPVWWLNSHFAVGGWSPLQRLSGMLTAHMTRIAPRAGFTWHPHRGLEIYTWVLEGTLHHEDSTGGQGDIGPGEFQRMFSGDWIEHQELNLTDQAVRVIQIWFVANPKHRGLEPHYQQPRPEEFCAHRVGAAIETTLIGEGSPMESHLVGGRLNAVTLAAGGTLDLDAPRADEDLFTYVTDGAGQVAHTDQTDPLGQYDVVLARRDAPTVTLRAAPDQPLHLLNFYLPKFLGE
jgi:redox-sensitive bicupin YhaK (pirin superfamily)